jgi:hypothetical protein
MRTAVARKSAFAGDADLTEAQPDDYTCVRKSPQRDATLL